MRRWLVTIEMLDDVTPYWSEGALRDHCELSFGRVVAMKFEEDAETLIPQPPESIHHPDILQPEPPMLNGLPLSPSPANSDSIKIFIWHAPSGVDFITFSNSEDSARQAIINHPEIGEMLANEDYLSLVAGPATEVVEPGHGAVYVMNAKVEDRNEVG